MKLFALKTYHPRIFHILDRCLVFFVLLPCVVGFWAGVWSAWDIFVTFREHAVNECVCAGAGFAVIIVLNYLQFTLTNHFLRPNTTRNIICKRAYSLVAGVANVLVWRGVWVLQDHYIGIGTASALILLYGSTKFLVLLRASCNGTACPLGTAFDEADDFFLIPTRFNIKPNQPLLYLADVTFSVAVLGSLTVIEWRSIWVLLDLVMFPSGTYMSFGCCLMFGYTVCGVLDLLQNKAVEVSRNLDAKKEWWLRIAFEDIYYFIAKVGVLATWRGLWNFCDVLIIQKDIPSDNFRVWIPLGLGYIIPCLLLHTKSMILMGIYLDGAMADGQGCKISVTMLQNFLKLKSSPVEKWKDSEDIRGDPIELESALALVDQQGDKEIEHLSTIKV